MNTEKEKRIKKLERLIWHHRAHIFHDNDFIADCHSRALARLKASKTFAEMARDNEDAARQRRSARLLNTYA
jgi:hypothetical protein